ncbi:hypothetical protein HYQ46_003800 [Verticillium longisporum]|nr:hypothetical protein HYQ46_003800 [Verticillium longisporum]
MRIIKGRKKAALYDETTSDKVEATKECEAAGETKVQQPAVSQPGSFGGEAGTLELALCKSSDLSPIRAY